MIKTIYLDNHATTPLAPEVYEAMRPYWIELAANPSSPHAAGAIAHAAVEEARSEIAALMGAATSEVYFTSGATEANNIALIGAARAALRAGIARREVVISPIEHSSVYAAAEALRDEGFTVVEAPIERDGRVRLERLSKLLGPQTLMVSVGFANGEIGTIQPIKQIAEMAHSVGAVVHSDLAQAPARLAINVSEWGLDLASMSAHKMYGPPGVGALFVSASTPLRPLPLHFGGGQEFGLRPGTVPVPLVVGMGAAAKLAYTYHCEDARRLIELAERFLEELAFCQVGYEVNGPRDNRLPGSLSIQLIGVDGRSIVERVSARLCLSTGSACQAGQIEPSHVLKGLGLSRKSQESTIRVCFGRYSRISQIPEAASLIALAVQAEKLATGQAVQ